MTWPKPNPRPTRSPSLVRQKWVVAALLVVVAMGCRSGPQGEIYTYETLPRSYLAAKRDNAQTVDLSRLASTAQNSEIIDTGDVLEVTIATGLSEKDRTPFPVRVHEDGTANIPVVGPVAVAGLEPEAAEAAITAACVQRQLYRSPHVTVTMKRQRVNRVTVVGAVKEPGVYEIPRGSSDLLAALVAAGGLADDAGTQVEIRNPAPLAAPTGRSAPPIADGTPPDDINQAAHRWSTPAQPVKSSPLQSLKVDLISATRQGGTSNYRVADGGVVMVEKRDPEPVHVIGLVRKADRYEFPIGEDLTVLGAIALAGGTSSPVANKVYVIRRKPESTETVVVNLSLSSAKKDERANLRLAPGDIVSVEQTPATVMLDALQIVRLGISGSVPLMGL